MPPKSAPKAKAAATGSDHPSYQAMITDAIIALKERSGSSRAALKKYVSSNNKNVPEGKIFDSLFNRALKGGVAKGVFEQPKGPSGGTKLAKKEPKPAAAAKPKTTVKKTPSTKVVAKKPAVKKATTTKKAPAAEKPAAKPAVKKAAAPKKTAVTKKPAAKKAAPKAKKPAAPKAAPAIVEKPTVLSKTKSGRVTKTTPKTPAVKKAAPKKKATPKKATPKAPAA